MALFSLLMQTIADVQKFRHKARDGADAPCFGGLWSLTRHPNYLGEIGFQVVGANANPNPNPNPNPIPSPNPSPSPSPSPNPNQVGRAAGASGTLELTDPDGNQVVLVSKFSE